MTEERRKIEIPEICRVEGHSAVYVDIVGGEVENVVLDVFEGTRFFERIVIGHHFEEMPHITSRVCAICSTGHVLAAAFALEKILGFTSEPVLTLYRELMHLGMVIESHATHIYALALPDYLGACDLMEYATRFASEFQTWTALRNLGAAIQSCIGGRPFHPVNLHVGGLSRYPSASQLSDLSLLLSERRDKAIRTCEILLGFKPRVGRTTVPEFLALEPADNVYGFFGDTVRSSSGWKESVQNYREYLNEESVPYSHAKRSTARGKPLMVGAMARLYLFGDRLGGEAAEVFKSSPLAAGDTNSLWNNLAQGIEVLDSIDRCQTVIREIATGIERQGAQPRLAKLQGRAGHACGAVECPRGTLYHYYEVDQDGYVTAADMITPSAQNSYRIEQDIKEVVAAYHETAGDELQSHLETLVRAYDPCNTCATHMVRVRNL